MKKVRFSTLMAVSVLAAVVVASCKKDEATSLPPIGGYATSNDVAAANLLAHWPFDGSNNERISNTAPSNSMNASFTTGASGQRQALSLASGYLVYPTIAALSSANAIPSVTVSAWVKVQNTGTAQASSVFALTQAQATQSDWNQGPINMYFENNKPTAKGDTLVLHSAFHTYSGGNYSTGGDNINDFGNVGTDYQITKVSGQWFHYVMTYDGGESRIKLYANGQLVSNKNFELRKTGTPEVPIGNITVAVPTQVLIGGWPNATTGYTKSPIQAFQGLFNGSIDEVRVYSKALAQTDIGSLYQLEQAGR